MEDNDNVVLDQTSNFAVGEHLNESILDLFETNEEIEGFSLAVCW